MNLLKRYAVPVACAAAVLALAACSSSKDARRVPTPLTEFKPVMDVQQVWKASVGKGGRYLFSPVAVGDAVYAAGENGSVEKIDAKTGQTLWRAKVGSDLSAGVGSDGNLTAVGALKGGVFVLGRTASNCGRPPCRARSSRRRSSATASWSSARSTAR